MKKAILAVILTVLGLIGVGRAVQPGTPAAADCCPGSGCCNGGACCDSK